MQLALGLNIIDSYKRLSYTPWHALAEFVDNSTQSYMDHAEELDGKPLHVSIVYDRDSGIVRIVDDAMGMSSEDLAEALRVGRESIRLGSRSQYGLGMKTAACWLGNVWTITTKKLGSTEEHMVTIDVEQVAMGNNDLPHEVHQGKTPDQHYTIIEIRELNRPFKGRTLPKIKDFLGSMYRHDIAEGSLVLEWQNVPLQAPNFDDRLLWTEDRTQQYKKTFEFNVGDKRVWGWVGILERGSRSLAGFSVLRFDRVVKGWPEAWRPETIFGQERNDLINQRLIGEINLDDFAVSHTKDEILWLGGEEDEVLDKLAQECREYTFVARTRRSRGSDGRGPTDEETRAAIDELRAEIESPEMVDTVVIDPTTPLETLLPIVQEPVLKQIEQGPETFRVRIGNALTVRVYLETRSVNDPYLLNDFPQPDELVVVVNSNHPHWHQLQGSEGVLNYLRHCVYDGIAEWQATRRHAPLQPDTIKSLKDRLLRVPMYFEGLPNDVVPTSN